MSQPITQLNRYRLLGNSGMRVSPICLGTMTFGTEWGFGSDLEESRRILDIYADRGGNFLDTANIYTGGSSESYIGQILQNRRDKFVIATKYSLSTDPTNPNAGGNHRKALVTAILLRETLRERSQPQTLEYRLHRSLLAPRLGLSQLH
jgi:aryl-alcohol dehydrogenase-like predicted oxidoreductase